MFAPYKIETTLTELDATALDRQRWRTLTQSASSALEEERRHQAQSA